VSFILEPNSFFRVPEDIKYYESLPDLPLAGGSYWKYVGSGDISSFIPSGEDESLLFLPQPPPTELPSWPRAILHLNGIYVSQCDDFTTVETTDARIIELLDTLPQADS
jgi:hypothetical protein